MNNETFYRVQMDIVRQPDGNHIRNILQLCWERPVLDENNNPISPFVERGITDLVLSEHPELKALVEQATALAVPLAIAKINEPTTESITLPTE